jgi:hypothetical protein
MPGVSHCVFLRVFFAVYISLRAILYVFLFHTDVACCPERDPFRGDWNAKPHGRVDAVMVATRSVLVFVAELDVAFGPTLTVLVPCLAGVLTLYVYMTYLPFYKQVVNNLHVSAAMVYCWACFCVVLLQIRQQPAVRTKLMLMRQRRTTLTDVFHAPQRNVEAFVFLFGLPSTAYAGFDFGKMMYNRLGHKKESLNPFMVRLR